ncbi:MAG: hypothetical protein H6703_12070 [Myxococcales bacterium]|nr:hypothetical protein [Myxococcales bacterium]
MNKPILIAALLALPAVSHAELSFIPMLGLADIASDDDDADYDAGVNIGLSFGGRIAPIFSLHGQLHVHPLSFDERPGVEQSGALAVFQIAPMFHLVDDGDIELLLGPVLGGFALAVSGEDSVDSVTASLTGGLFGAQASLFFSLTPSLSLGPMVQYALMYVTEACLEINGFERCDDVDDDEGTSLLLASAALKIDF